MATAARSELKLKAKQSMEGKWFDIIVFFLLYLILHSIATATGLGMLLFSGVLLFGFNAFFLDLIRKNEITLNHLFSGFQYYLDTLKLFLLSAIYVVLWSLLFVIPGIMKAFSYAMIYFIMKDNPQIEAGQAIDKSIALMKGNRWRLFVLCLSFFWWFMLCAVTAGIAIVYVGPYISATFAGFYQDLIDNKKEQ